MRKEKGITLVALVITIIVLLILAGVTINLTLGERGIFTTAKNAAEETKIAEYKERIELSRVTVASENLGEVTLDKLKAQIVKDGIVKEIQIVETDNYLKITTDEGYVFIVTAEKTELLEDESQIAIPPVLQEQDIEIVITNEEVWTNQSKTVTITKNNVEEAFTLQYSLNLGKTWKDYTEEFEVYENCTISVTLRNSVGERSAATTYEVTKIDKTAPVITSVETTPTTVSFTATDEASGIVGYTATNDTTVPTTFEEVEATSLLEKEVNVENQNTTYYVWVKDQAGNVSEYSKATTTMQAVTNITIPTSATIIKGNKTTLKATVDPSNAYNKEITWASDNESVATVDSNGEVTAVATGTANITATAQDGSNVTSNSCIITVQEKTYLIKNGIDQTSVTGGWINRWWTIDAGRPTIGGSLNQVSGALRFSNSGYCNATVCTTAKMVDLTNGSLMTVNFSSAKISGYATIVLSDSNGRGLRSENLATPWSSNSLVSYGPGSCSFDISSCEGTYYVGIQQVIEGPNATQYIDITEISIIIAN